MTVAIGSAHPNSGLIGDVDVFGALYVGGAGMWVFTPVGEYPGMTKVRLSSQRNLIHEIRAGAALCLGLGNARELLESDGGNFANLGDGLPLDLSASMVEKIGRQSHDHSVSMFIAGEGDLVEEVRPHADDDGWSVVLCSETDRHVESQWDSAATQWAPDWK